MKAKLFTFAILLASCQDGVTNEAPAEIDVDMPYNADPVIDEAGPACEQATLAASNGISAPGVMVLQYVVPDGQNHISMTTWPLNSEGNVDVICKFDPEKREIISIFLDTEHTDGKEIKKELLPDVPKELRKF